MVKKTRKSKLSKKLKPEKVSMKAKAQKAPVPKMHLNEFQTAISTGDARMLQRALDKRCDALERMQLAANSKKAASKFHQWKHKRALSEIKILVKAMLKTEQGQALQALSEGETS